MENLKVFPFAPIALFSKRGGAHLGELTSEEFHVFLLPPTCHESLLLDDNCLE